MQVFEFLRKLGADFHPHSKVHSVFNQLFWNISSSDVPSGVWNPLVEECSILSKFLRILHHPMGGAHLATLFLLHGEEEESEKHLFEQIVSETTNLRMQQRAYRLAAARDILNMMEHDIFHQETTFKAV